MKRIKFEIESLHIWLAISYLGLAKYDLFWEHINKVEQQKNIAYGWIAAYYILQKEIAQAKYFTEKIESTAETDQTIAFLNGILLCEEGKTEEGSKILQTLLPTLRLALTKQIAMRYVGE